MATPLVDYDGWQITPTLHSDPIGTSIDPTKVRLPSPFNVCIIGASKGIGAYIAYAYAMAGASGILITGRDMASLDQVAEEVKRRSPIPVQVAVHPARCEITSEPDIIALRDEVDTKFGGRLDVLVVNPALWGNLEIRVTEGSTKQWRNIVDIDLIGAYLAAHHLVPALLNTADGARAFVCICGPGAWATGGPFAHTAHCVSKLAQARLVEHMANDFAKEGLLVSAVSPGCVRTESSMKGAPEFIPYLIDDPLLCGAFLVWLTKTRENRLWLSGRYLSATWDADELLGMKEAIVEKDMLKARMALT